MELAQLTDEEQKLVDGYLSGEPLQEEEISEPEKKKPGQAEEQPEPAEERQVQEKPVEQTEAKKPEDDRPTTPEAWAKLRWEASEAKRQAKAAQEEIERLKNPPKAIPAKEENYEGHVEGRIETVEERLNRLESEREEQRKDSQEKAQLMGAINELTQFESAYSQKVPEYGEAANHVRGLIGASIKLLEPDIEPEELAKRVVKTYLQKAANAYRLGYDPAEAIYKEAVNLGYARKEQQPEERKQDNFKKIAENKKRSGMAAASGSGGAPETTEEMADKMSMAEFSRLSPEQIDRMLYSNM